VNRFIEAKIKKPMLMSYKSYNKPLYLPLMMHFIFSCIEPFLYHMFFCVGGGLFFAFISAVNGQCDSGLLAS
jgi:hypothetical protein